MNGSVSGHRQEQIDGIDTILSGVVLSLNDSEYNSFFEDVAKFQKIADEALYNLRIAKVFTRCIESFLSGDDDEMLLYRKLADSLGEINASTDGVISRVCMEGLNG